MVCARSRVADRVERRGTVADAQHHDLGHDIPSSTVAIARRDGSRLDLLVLGDSQIATPRGNYVDRRIDRIAQAQRAAYRARLAKGSGYDNTHRELLKSLQIEQARHRNTEGGYWIAETVPAAAHHAITASENYDLGPPLVLATDGAYRSMQHLGLDNWTAVASKPDLELKMILRTLEHW